MLAMSYLSIESHPLFKTVRCLLEETNITQADVAENLMPKEEAEMKAKKEAEMKVEKEKGTSEEDSLEEEAEDAEDKKLDLRKEIGNGNS
ncbi:hypothetical protein MTR_1g008630 [Medicago truncatula]|uniref:AAA+ ATPase At3g28540-like C-terminal domain-containing protein n=1 Tax=Medicago truncatula TaxID=3880 RepID=G7I4E6_MEDTR|nr:hypothetical protein MTR_1g008630 [Medicago truncatula]